MPIPESPRVLYLKNPLDEVLCQLRFPAILRIGAEVPAAFQDRIRGSFPIYEERHPGTVHNLKIPAEIAQLLGDVPGTASSTEYMFRSADEIWQLTLTKEFIALSTQKYGRWEEFRERLEAPFSALLDVYQPAFFARIGLRYRDVIKRSALNLKDQEWKDLLQPAIAGLLVTAIRHDIEETSSLTRIRLPEYGEAKVRYGPVPTDSEVIYSIDCDYSTTERKAPDEARNTLDYFNRQSGRLFRWCISDPLHAALDPELLD